MMNMIRTTLGIIRQKLDENIRNADPRKDDWVIISNITDLKGQPCEYARDKIVMLLANIQKEATTSIYQQTNINAQHTHAPLTSLQHIDLFVLFYANFCDGNYEEGLSAISRTISFFQQNPIFTHHNVRDLGPTIDKVIVEMVNLDLVELNCLFGMIGVNYLPSVYYKVRMVAFGSNWEQDAQVSKVVEAPGKVQD